jgi:hypothetical protein
VAHAADFAGFSGFAIRSYIFVNVSHDTYKDVFVDSIASRS